MLLSGKPVWSLCIRLMGALVMVAAVTGACLHLPVNPTTTGFAYLVAVLLIATVWGITEAVVASAVGLLCFNFFFLPPVKTFSVADPQNWVALFAFLATAIVASELSARAKRQTHAALARQRELERLHSLGRGILLDQGGASLPQRLAQFVAESFEFPAVALYDVASEREYKAGPQDLTIPDSAITAALSGDIVARTDDLSSRFALIRLGGKPAGLLALRGEVSDTTVDAISNLVAIGLERARTQEAENRAQAARQSEELKSTLLDAIAHEFKTPLTSIKAATSSLLASTQLPSEQRELLSIVDEEADRLDNLVSDAIQMSRIEGGKFKVNRCQVSVHDVIETVIRQMRPRLDDRPVEVQVASCLATAFFDPNLIQLALRELIDNANKYSPASSAIRVGADFHEGNLRFWVADAGPGIASHESRRVFERFYRAKSTRDGVPGSGLGLSVVLDIAKAHGGDASAVTEPAGGSRVEISIPGIQDDSDECIDNPRG